MRNESSRAVRVTSLVWLLALIASYPHFRDDVVVRCQGSFMPFAEQKHQICSLHPSNDYKTVSQGAYIGRKQRI